MKKGEMRPVNQALFTTKVGRCYKQVLSDRKFVFNLILLPSLICFLLVGCVSTRHSSSGKNTPQKAFFLCFLVFDLPFSLLRSFFIKRQDLSVKTTSAR